jgi:aryl-alcohol dehydrogenase-like predicted oxidoreductase
VPRTSTDTASSPARSASIRTIQRALDLGVTHIDTAEIYGRYANEELVGRNPMSANRASAAGRSAATWSRIE